jgi:hypothetical protein
MDEIIPSEQEKAQILRFATMISKDSHFQTVKDRKLKS